MTLKSRAISSPIAVAIASANIISRAIDRLPRKVPPASLPASCEQQSQLTPYSTTDHIAKSVRRIPSSKNVINSILRGRQRTSQSKLHSVFHLRPRSIFYAPRVRLRQTAIRNQHRPKLRQRIARLPCSKLRLIPINLNRLMLIKLRRHRRHSNRVPMRAKPVNLRLNQARPKPRPRAIHSLADNFEDLKRISAIHSRTRNAERLRLLRKRISRDPIGVLKTHVPVSLMLIILQNKNHWQLPNRRKIQRLVKRSLLRRPIAEEAINHLPGIFHLRRKRRPSSMRDALPHNPRSPRKMMCRIAKMHRAAKSFAQAVPARINLRHHFPSGSPQRDRISVATVARHHRIGFLPRGQRANDARLRAVCKMRMPANHSRMLNKSSLDAFLKLADAEHLRVNPNQPFFPKRLFRCHRCALQNSIERYDPGTRSPGPPIYPSTPPTGTSAGSRLIILSSTPFTGESSS